LLPDRRLDSEKEHNKQYKHDNPIPAATDIDGLGVYLALLLVTIPVEFVGPILAQEEEGAAAPDPETSVSDESEDKGEDLKAKLKKAEEKLRANRAANEERFKQLSQEYDKLKERLGDTEAESETMRSSEESGFSQG